jgi:glycosyltransferase involved in cell wall biosynthesis
MIKLLGFALYGPQAASTRYRLEQYIPGLAQMGIDLQVHYLLGDEYLRRSFGGSSLPWPYLLRSGIARLADLRRQKHFEASILHCELFPLMPGWIERALLREPYIYDFDDAFYLKYKVGRLSALRPVLGNKFDTVMQGAAAITAGNRTLASYARVNNKQTHLLPTVVDTLRYTPLPHAANAQFTVGWIGSPSTAFYLAELAGPLAILARDGPVRLIVIGGKAPQIPGVSVEEVAWSEQLEVEQLNSFDVGVMPLPDDDWARGKCAFKLIQYMACGVPVIASRVGANVDVVTADCGVLVASEQEWVDALRLLRDQPGRRKAMGVVARLRAEEKYSLSRNLPILAQVIRQVARRGAG